MRTTIPAHVRKDFKRFAAYSFVSEDDAGPAVAPRAAVGEAIAERWAPAVAGLGGRCAAIEHRLFCI
jgi:hypothetical protein